MFTKQTSSIEMFLLNFLNIHKKAEEMKAMLEIYFKYSSLYV